MRTRRKLSSYHKRKSLLEIETEKLSLELNNKEIYPREFAERFPIVIDRLPKEEIISNAVSKYKRVYGEAEFNKIQNDSDSIANIVRKFVLSEMSNFYNGYKRISKNEKALDILRDRAADDLMRLYPWLVEGYKLN